MVLLATACGGKVVVDAGGNGGSGSSGSDVTSTGVVTPVSVSTGGVTLCEQVCASQAAKGCDTGGDCVFGCQQSYATAGTCTSLLDALVICLLNSTAPGCENPVECQDDILSYGSCINGDPGECVDVSCGGNGGACGCKGICDDRSLGVECTPGNATDFCTCFENGMPVGECSMPQIGPSPCDLLDGCCASVFFP